MTDGNGVAQGNTLQNSGIIRLFPERLKGNGQRRHGCSKWVVFEVVIGVSAESVLSRLVFIIKVGSEITDKGFPLHQGGIADWQKHLRQRDRRFCAVLCRHNGVRQKVGIDIGIFVVMLQIREILAVFNHHTRFLPTALMVDDFEVVPLKFAAPEVKKRTCHAAQAGADTLGFGNRECLCRGVIGLAGKVVGCCGVLKHTLHRKGRRDIFIRPLPPHWKGHS